MLSKFRNTVTLIIFGLFLSFPGYAQGNLMLFPKRLVFDGAQRSQEINLINTSKDTAFYAISIINYKMTKDGSFEIINEPEEGEKFADEFLRYYPRRVSLGPSESQTVKVQLIKTNLINNGEYRSHIYFRADEKQTAIDKREMSETGEDISVKIKMVFGISIPVIIRKGENKTSINFSDISINHENELPEINIGLNRDGNMSVNGDLFVKHISLQGKVTNIGVIKGISVYTPNPKRTLALPLKNTENIDLNEGQIEIVYEDKEGKLLGSTIVDL